MIHAPHVPTRCSRRGRTAGRGAFAAPIALSFVINATGIACVALLTAGCRIAFGTPAQSATDPRNQTRCKPARAVVYDITLDGNTFRSSHRVDKRPVVADVTYGVAMVHGHWRIAMARYHRSREFHGQKEVPVYGTLAIGRRF